MFLTPVLVLACCLVGVPLASSVPVDDEPLCGNCQTTGKVANKLRTSADEAEADVIYCSEAMRKDSVGFGVEELACPKCKGTSYNASGKAEVDAEILRRKSWLEERESKVDGNVGHDVVHIRTAHFVLSYDITTTKVGQQVLKAHAAAHLYAKRLEELYAEMLKIHGLSPQSIRMAKRYVYLMESERTAAKIGITVSDGGARKTLYGDPSQTITYFDKMVHQDDEGFHEHVVHVVSHILYHDMDQGANWLVKRYGWMSEGLSHYLEIRLFGVPNTSCGVEAGAFVHWKGKNWEANVKKALLAGEAPKFEEVQERPADALSAMEHQFAWSWVDYLIWLDPKALPKLLGYMKGPQLPVRECLQRAYGISLPAFVQGWEEFVKSQYSLTPHKGPQVRPPRDAKAPPADEDGATDGDGKEDDHR